MSNHNKQARLELLQRWRERGYLTLEEVVNASAHSPVDLDEVDEILGEAGVSLEDGGRSRWERLEEPEDELEEEELEEDEVEEEAELLPTRFFQPAEYTPETPA